MAKKNKNKEQEGRLYRLPQIRSHTAIKHFQAPTFKGTYSDVVDLQVAYQPHSAGTAKTGRISQTTYNKDKEKTRT